MSFYRLFIVLALICPLLITRQGRADELKRIRTKIEVEEARLSQIKKERSSIGSDLQKIKLELQELEKTKAGQNQILQKTEKELRVVELSQNENDRRLVQETFALETSLVEMYKIQKRKKGLELLLNANSSMDLLKRSHQLAKMAEYGDEVMTRLAKLKEQLTGEKLVFEDLLIKRRSELEMLQKTVDTVELKKKQDQGLLKELQRKEREQKTILAGLTEQAKQVEMAIANVTGEKEEREPSSDRFQGGGLEAFKGKLDLPVRGKLVQRFGKAQNQEFSDLVVVKGLEMASPVGEEVHPVAKGKVVLADVVPGFGNVIIIDHGSRFYSLYGRLNSTLAHVGSIVSSSDTVGTIGELDFKGRNFYFEIRVKGKAIDPKSFISKQSLNEAGA